MPIQITITGKNASEVIELVKDLANVLPKMNPANIPEKTVVTTEDTAPEPERDETDTSNNTEPESETEPAEDKAISDQELRAVAAKKVKEGKKDELRSLLNEFGAKNVSSVPADKRAEFLERVSAL